MADSASESYFQSDTLGPRRISNSFFNVPGFSVGFSSRSSADPGSLRSPTSPLDFSFFSNLSNPFTHRFPRSPSQSVHQKKWDCSKVGLGIINILAENKPTSEVLDSAKGTNIIFGPQVKTSNSVRSKSLPRNYIVSLQSHSKAPNSQLGQPDALFGNEGIPLEWTTLTNSSLVSLTPKPNLNSEEFFSENETSVSSLLLPIGTASQMDDSLDIKPTSLPIPIGSGHVCEGSLSAREIELSEDYTCIISHGPNPKTTHIFGNSILECHKTVFSNFEKTENPGTELPCEATCPGVSNLNISTEFLSFCHSCKKKLKGDDIYMYRGEKAFCSFDCRSEENFAEEETVETCDNSSKNSTESGCHEDLFLIGMPISG